MNYKKKVGLDEWKVYISIQEFLNIVKQEELEIYELHIHHAYITFYSYIWQRFHIQHCFQNIEKVRTTGMLSYALRSFKKPSRIISLTFSILLWYVLSNTIFDIEIKGEQKKSKQLIQDTLYDMGYKIPFYDTNMEEVKTILKKRLENDIAWMEVYKQGSRYVITYTPKEFASISTLQHNELIAKEDGVIARFEIAHGNKVKKVNDFVHAGDVLVSNVLEDSKGTSKEVFVDGKVYAYTWKDVVVSMDNNKLPKSFQYFELLMEARRVVSQDFHKGDKIYKEKILQFSKDTVKIEMTIHYTLYKDITTP